MSGYTDSPAGSAGFGLHPAFDYFVAEDVFVGASSFVRYSSNTTAQQVKTHGWTGGAYVYFGRNVPLSELFSVRPKAALGIWHSSTTVEDPNLSGGYNAFPYVAHLQETVVVIDVYVPLLLHPAQHFFIGFGPDAYFDPYHSFTSDSSSAKHSRYSIGAGTTVGGWF